MPCKHVLLSQGQRFPRRQDLQHLGSWRTITGPGLLGIPTATPVFKEDGAAGVKYLAKSFLSRGGAAGTQQDSLSCKRILPWAAQGQGGTRGHQDEEHLTPGSCLSALSALSEEAETVTEKLSAL